MTCVQFSPGMKHAVAAEGVVVVLGDGGGSPGAGAGEDARRGFPAKQNCLSGHCSQRPLSPQV
jgi:hypothetical protein